MKTQLSQINNFQYIAASKDFNTRQKHVNAPLFRKQFRCDNVPKQAVLRIACVGFYRVFVNAEEVTKGYLAPYISNCNETVWGEDLTKYEGFAAAVKTIVKKLRSGENGFI